jgi:naphthalene 1,2-dioxygenase ferredoxin reductase component
MSFTVTIRRQDRPIEVEAGETILQAALAAGIAYPHGCQSGNCGACKSRLYQGEIELAAYSDYALTEEERGRGLILACRAMPFSDAEVAWLEPDEVVAHPLRRMTCRVERLEDATHDIKRLGLRIETGGPFTFSAGQYAKLSFAGRPARDFSMANPPHEELLEFHIRRVAGGGASNYAAERLASGETLLVEGPCGSACLRELHTGPILAMAGGSGLAPIKSIIETALRRGAVQPIHLYFGARAERDLYLEDHFRALAARHPNLRFVTVLSEPQGPTRRRTGYLHDAVKADLAELDGFKSYIAGPPVMVEAATAWLRQRGMPPEDIHADAFYTEAEKLALTAPA